MTYWAERRTPTLDAALLSRLPGDVPRWKAAYWQFQRDLTRRYILPLLKEADALPTTGRILEIGAGEGGCLSALQEATGLPADGLELSESRTELARSLNHVLSAGALDLLVGDITDPGTVARLRGPYGLVLLRDVIEHVEDRDAALRHCAELLADGAVVLLTFPPYFSPYGAHQQILRRPWLKLPWIQHAPFFLSMVRRAEPERYPEIASINRCSLTIGGFERSVSRLPLDVVVRRHYLVRPAFRYRYGLPVVRGGALGRLPGVRELVTTGSWYLLRRRHRHR